MNDKLEQLYNLYKQNGIIQSTDFNTFSSASDDQRKKLYDLGRQKGLFKTTDYNTFSSAFRPIKKKEQSVSPSAQNQKPTSSATQQTKKPKPSVSSSVGGSSKVFTGFPGKVLNEYRVVNDTWQKKEPGKDWVTIKNEGSISGLNKQFKQNVSLSDTDKANKIAQSNLKKAEAEKIMSDKEMADVFGWSEDDVKKAKKGTQKTDTDFTPAMAKPNAISPLNDENYSTFENVVNKAAQEKSGSASSEEFNAEYEKQKTIATQKHLKSIGYDVDVNGDPNDEKTVKYLAKEESKNKSIIDESFKAADTYDKIDSLVDKSLVLTDEEGVVDKLRKNFTADGFIFLESGMGDNVTIKYSPAPGMVTREITVPVDVNDPEAVIAIKDFMKQTYLSESEKTELSGDDVNSMDTIERAKYISRVTKLMAENPYKYGTTLFTDEEINSSINNTYNELKYQSRQLEQEYAKLKSDIDAFNDNPSDESERIRINNKMHELAVKEADMMSMYSNMESYEKSAGKIAAIEYEKKAGQGNFLGILESGFFQGLTSIEKAMLLTSMDVLPYAVGEDIVDPITREKLKDDGYSDSKILDYASKQLKQDIYNDVKNNIGWVGSGMSTTEEYKTSEERNDIEKVASFLSESIATSLSGGGSSALQKFAFFTQSYNGMEEQMMGPQFDGLSEGEKKLISVPYGMVIGALERYGVASWGQGKNPLVDRLAMSVVNKTMLSLPKDASISTIKREINKRLSTMLLDGTVRVVGGSLIEGGTEGTQQLFETSEKWLVNEITGKDYFKDIPDLTTYDGVMKALDIAKTDAYYGAIGGLIMAGGSNAINVVRQNRFESKEDKKFNLFYNSLMDNSLRSTMTLGVKLDLKDGKITKEEAKQRIDAIKSSYAVASQIPENLSIRDKRDSFNLILEKKKLEEDISKYDEALTTPERSRLAEINEQLKTISQNAVQEQTTGEVSVQPETTTGQEVEGGKPEAGPKVVTEEGKEEVDSYIVNRFRTLKIEPIVGPLLDKMNNAEYIDDADVDNALEVIFAELDNIDNSEYSDDVKKNVKDSLLNLAENLDNYEFRTKDKTVTVAQKRAADSTRENVRKVKVEEFFSGAKAIYNGEEVEFDTADGTVKAKRPNGETVVLDTPSMTVKEDGIVIGEDGNLSTVTMVDRFGSEFTFDGDIALDLAIKDRQNKIGEIPAPVFEVVMENMTVKEPYIKESKTEVATAKAVEKQAAPVAKAIEQQAASVEETTQNKTAATETETTEVEDTTNDPVTYSQSLGDAITAMKEEGKGLDLQVSPVSVEEASTIVKDGGKIFMTKDRTAGGYVKKDGYMGGLFKNPKSPLKKVAKAVQQARVKAGGFFMDAYATELEPMYIKNGFRPVARLKFNEEYAPEGWDAEGSPLKNKPDVVFFAYDPDGNYKVGDGDYVESYDQAYEMAKSIGTDLKTSREAAVLSEAFGPTNVPLSKQVKRAQKAIAKILPDVKIIVHDTESEYRKATGETDSKKQASRGEYNPTTNTIHINKQKANGRTVAHEVFHAVIIKKVGTDAAATQLTDKMIRAVNKAVKSTGNKELASYLNDFMSNYNKNIQSEEKMAELVGYLAENFETLPLPTRNVIKQWIDSLLKRFGFKPMTDNEIVELMNTIAGKVAVGEEIEGIVSEWNSEYTAKRKQLTESESKRISEEVVRKTKKGKNFNTFKIFQTRGNVESVKFEGEINQYNVKKEIPSSYNTVASKIDLYNTAITESVDFSNVEKTNEKEHKIRLSENKDKINKKIASAKKKIDKIKSTKYKSIDDKTKKLDSAISKYKILQDLIKSKSLIEMSNKIKNIDNRVLKSSLHNELIYNISDGFKRLSGDALASKSDAVYSTTKDIIKKNLRVVYDSVSPTIRSISKLWYDGANVIAQNWADEYGLSLEQVSAIIATQSPQMPWFDNLHLAHVIMDTMSNANNLVFTEEMYNDYVSKAKEYDAQKKYIPNVKKLIGKKLSDLNDYDAAIFIRLDYDANISRKAPVRIPSGTNVDVVQKGDSSFSGYDVIAKGVSVFRNGSDSNIDENIGRANKVRNFYLNIADPSNNRAVTIDTHAMAIALMKPLASNDFEVDFGPASFAFYADAYRELANELGIKARELQSITWEAARAIFPAKKKAKEGYKNDISSIWDKYNSGDISLEQVHLEIFNQSENPNITEWSDHIKELKDEKKRKDVSGRIVRKQKSETFNRLGDVSGIDTRASRDGGRLGVVDDGPKVRKQLSPEIQTALTEDGKGNYVFHHYSEKRRPTIKPGSGTNIITGKDEGSALSSVGGLAQYYTMKGQAEPGVGNELHTVLVPIDRVYDFYKDPDNLLGEANKRFEKARPGQAFNPNYQLAFITQVANENGYEMVVAPWRNNEYRAQTTLELSPESTNTQLKERAVETYNVGDSVEVFGVNATITEVNGSVLTYKGDRVSGKIDIDRSPRSIKKTVTTRKQIDNDAQELSSKKQKKDNTLYKIVKKGRELGLSDAGIRKYAVDNGYTDKQISDAIVEYNLTEEGIFVKGEGRVISNSIKSFKRKMLSARSFLPRSVFKLKEQKDSNIAYHLNMVDRNVKDFNRLYKAYKGDKDVLLENFDAYLRGDKNVKLEEDFKVIANSMRNQIDGLSRQLIASGLIEESQIATIAENLGSYLTRSYAVYERDNWKKEVSKEVLQKAKNYLRAQYRPWATEMAQKEGMDVEQLLDERVDAEIDLILTKDDKSMFAKGGKEGSKNLSVLKERMDIPVEIRMLMGEYSDPGLNYAQTVLKLSALAENHKFLTEVRNSGLGKFFYEKNDPRRPKEFNTEIAAKGSETMNPLNGLYTTKEIADAFSKQPSATSELMKLYMKVQSFVKWNKTIGSVATHAKNVVGNVGFVWMNSHADLSAISKAYNSVRNDLFNKSNQELREMMDKYIKLGIVKQSAGLGEIRDMFKDANWDDAMAERLSNKDLNFGQKVKRKALRAKKRAEDWYQAEDDFFKIVAYENESARYSEAMFGKKYKDLTADQKKEVDDVTSEIVKNVYPTYDRIPEAIQLIRRFPLMGNFVSFQAEAYRTMWNTMALAKQELSSENSEIKKIGAKRLVGATTYIATKSAVIGYLSMAAGTGFTGLMGYLFDDDDERQKDKDIREFIAPWSKNSDLMILEVGNGKIKYIDFSATDPHGGLKKAMNAFFLSDDPVDGLINALGGFIEPFIGEEMTTSAILDLRNNQDKYGRSIFNPEASLFDTGLDVTKYIYEVVEPGTISSIRRGYASEDKARELTANLTGYRVYDVDVNEQFGFKIKDLSERIKNAKKIYNSAFYDEDASDAKVNKEYNRSQEALDEIYQEMIRIYDSAERLGVNPDDLRTSMIDFGNMSKKDIRSIQAGEIPQLKEKRE
jgi:hypothetical protein